MDTQTLMICVALVAGLRAMPALNVFKICARQAGTLRVDPWRIRSGAAVQKVSQSLRTWFASLFTRRLAFACLAVLLAVMLAHFGAGHDVVALATAPALATLQSDRTRLLREAEAFKKDGTFTDDAARAAFDAKMAEVDALDVQIRAVEQPPAPASTITDAQRAEIVAGERTRTESIQTAVRVAGFDAQLAADLVKRGLTIEAARAEIFAKMEARSNENPTNPRIALGEDAKDKWFRGAANWLLVKGGAAPLVARATKVEQSTIDPGEFRGMTLLDLARQTLERSGRAFVGMDKQRLVSEALTFRSGITQSTSDFATLLENVMGKVLQAAYSITPDTWKIFCAQGSVSDFRAHNIYRMSTFGALDSLNEDGEFKNKAITDGEKGTITATTKGNIINVSRPMIVNDDMGVFTRLLTMLGRAAAMSVEVDVYALLAQNAGLGPTMLDGLTLFHATHGNIGTGSAIAAAAIDADRVLMAQQKDVSGNDFLDLRPAILGVPVGIGGVAKVINQSQYDPDTIANKSQMKPNIVVGLFREIVDSPRFTGTRRYLFADPSIAPVLEVAYLEGQTAPVLETKDGWRSDGAEMKVRFDYGVAAIDYRGAVTNAGV